MSEIKIKNIIILLGSRNEDCYNILRDTFKQVEVGELMLVQTPHRDMHKELGHGGIYNFLPDRCEVPNTFSLKQIIQDSLNAICPEVPKDYEEIDFQKAGLIDDGQGFYKFMSLTIEDGYIHAVIKKI